MSFFEQMKKKAVETSPNKESASSTEPIKQQVAESLPVKNEGSVSDKAPVKSDTVLASSKSAIESKPNDLSTSVIDHSVGRKYVVGIDLGTTHCVMSYADITEGGDDFMQQVMGISQLTSPSVIEEKLQLPSFLYQAHSAELPENSIVLPWNAKPAYIVGEIARNLGSKTPIRLVSSAKSWLCHAGVDCKSPILPPDAPEDVARVSPFQATQAYLEHMSAAWFRLHPNAPLGDQDVVITVPASFDPAARELTVEAARSVGLGQAILLEEPQAALYSWIDQTHGEWRKQAKTGDIILVIDVGGGTTDLSLIAVTEKDGVLDLTRIAVGNHILLGGDNMDLALAYTVKAKIEKEGKRLEPWQVQALTHGCRDAKEKLFSSHMTSVPIVVPSRGSSLIDGVLRSELTIDEVRRVLIDGFLPQVAVSERPVAQTRTGLRTTGLPYAQDAGITRHLAAFLAKQQNAVDVARQLRLRDTGGMVLVDFIHMESPKHRDRVIDALRDALARDRSPCSVLGWSRMGLCELTRKRSRATLPDFLAARPDPARKRRRKSVESAGYDVMRRLRAEAAARPGATLAVTAHPDVVDWLNLAGRPAALAEIAGKPPALEADPACPVDEPQIQAHIRAMS